MCGYTGCVELSYIQNICIPQPGHRYAAGMLGRRGRGYPRSDGRACVRVCVCLGARVREEDKTTACDYSTRLYMTTTTIAALHVRTPRWVHADPKRNIRIGVRRGDVKVKIGYVEKKSFSFTFVRTFVVFTTVYTRCSVSGKHNEWHKSSY